VDIFNRQGKDGVTTKFTVNSFVKQVGNKDLCSVICEQEAVWSVYHCD
jgi:hypothetical protein